MEFVKGFRPLRSEIVPTGEPKPVFTEPEAKRWEEAYLGTSLSYQDVYATLLALRKDPSKKIYASLVVDPRSVSIDIPLVDHTPQETLAQAAYETTFFGEVDPDKYRAFATGEYTRDHLLAVLNRTTAGLSPDETPEWFYTTFSLKHLKPYGSIYIGSHGGQRTFGYSHNATIESRLRGDVLAGRAAISAIDFAQATQMSLPHISVNPLPIDDYLQAIQSTLKFLPKDWDLASGKTL